MKIGKHGDHGSRQQNHTGRYAHTQAIAGTDFIVLATILFTLLLSRVGVACLLAVAVMLHTMRKLHWRRNLRPKQGGLGKQHGRDQ